MKTAEQRDQWWSGLCIGFLLALAVGGLFGHLATKHHYERLNDIAWDEYEVRTKQFYGVLQACGDRCIRNPSP